MPSTRKFISNMNISRTADGVVFGDVHYDPGGECGPRQQSDFQFFLLFSGAVEIEIDDRVHHLAPGQGILLRPGHQERFQFSRAEPSRHGWCALQPAVVGPELREHFLSHPDPGHLSRAVSRLFQSAFDPARSGPETGSAEAIYLLQLGRTLLSRFIADQVQSDAPPDPAREKVEKVVAFIQNEYRRPLNLDDLARAAGVSPQHLLRLFRQAGETTPLRLLYRLRLERAQELLQRTGLSIAEVSQSCGFESPFHFSRRFREAYGQPPRKFRQAFWNPARPR